jgi:hypothetical protein
MVRRAVVPRWFVVATSSLKLNCDRPDSLRNVSTSALVTQCAGS